MVKKIIYLLILICQIFSTNIYAKSKIKKILIIHSYHQGYEWSDGIHTGIIDTLKNNENLDIYVEYLDLIRQKETEEYLDLWTNFLKSKYENIGIDVLLAVDDNSFNFLLKKRDLIFKNIPLVFCGVNDFQKEMIKNQKNITGVNEQKSIKETIKLAISLSKNAKKLGVIAGYRLSERKNLEQFKRDIKNFENKIKLFYFDNMEFEEILNNIKNFYSDDLIFYLSYQRSPSGKILDNTENLKKISQETPAKIFTISDHMIKADVIGGKVTYAYNQGQSAGTMVLEILKGRKADDIPILMESPNKYVFNGEALIKHRILLTSLPKDSIIINKDDDYLIKQWEEELKKSFFGYEIFKNNGTVMLIIDPRTGKILDANDTAKLYYGYPKLIGKKIQEINTLSDEELKKEMTMIKELKRNFFRFKHRLASGEIRDVEVYSYPIKLENENLLFSIIFDVTEKLKAEKEKEKEHKKLIIVLLSLFFISLAFIIILIFYLAVRKKFEKLLIEENKKLEEAHNQIKTLEGIIPICMHCKKIRDDKGYWNQLEKYISEHTSALLSHALCPDCAKKNYGEFLKNKKEE